MPVLFSRQVLLATHAIILIFEDGLKTVSGIKRVAFNVRNWV